jgi:hypothetical protein
MHELQGQWLSAENRVGTTAETKRNRQRCFCETNPILFFPPSTSSTRNGGGAFENRPSSSGEVVAAIVGNRCGAISAFDGMADLAII